MRHSIALVTGATSGLGYAAARLLADGGWQEVIVTGRSLTKTKETAAQLADETKKRVFTPLELDLNKAASAKSAVAELVKRGRRSGEYRVRHHRPAFRQRRAQHA